MENEWLQALLITSPLWVLGGAGMALLFWWGYHREKNKKKISLLDIIQNPAKYENEFIQTEGYLEMVDSGSIMNPEVYILHVEPDAESMGIHVLGPISDIDMLPGEIKTDIIKVNGEVKRDGSGSYYIQEAYTGEHDYIKSVHSGDAPLAVQSRHREVTTTMF